MRGCGDAQSESVGEPVIPRPSFPREILPNSSTTTRGGGTTANGRHAVRRGGQGARLAHVYTGWATGIIPSVLSGISGLGYYRKPVGKTAGIATRSDGTGARGTRTRSYLVKRRRRIPHKKTPKNAKVIRARWMGITRELPVGAAYHEGHFFAFLRFFEAFIPADRDDGWRLSPLKAVPRPQDHHHRGSDHSEYLLKTQRRIARKKTQERKREYEKAGVGISPRDHRARAAKDAAGGGHAVAAGVDEGVLASAKVKVSAVNDEFPYKKPTRVTPHPGQGVLIGMREKKQAESTQTGWFQRQNGGGNHGSVQAVSRRPYNLTSSVLYSNREQRHDLDDFPSPDAESGPNETGPAGQEVTQYVEQLITRELVAPPVAG